MNHEYRAVLAKVDAKFADIRGRHEASFGCRNGCHACCAPGLRVATVEQQHLAEHIRMTPGLRTQLEALAAADPHGGTRCALLMADGACAVYEARPLICRSHGAPVRVREAGQVRLDVCSLHFRGVQLAALPPGDCIDVETLNTLLFVVNRRAHPDDAGERHLLTLEAILAADDPRLKP